MTLRSPTLCAARINPSTVRASSWNAVSLRNCTKESRLTRRCPMQEAALSLMPASAKAVRTRNSAYQNAPNQSTAARPTRARNVFITRNMRTSVGQGLVDFLDHLLGIGEEHQDRKSKRLNSSH